jgi:2-iminoacetate synthase ThiH
MNHENRTKMTPEDVLNEQTSLVARHLENTRLVAGLNAKLDMYEDVEPNQGAYPNSMLDDTEAQYEQAKRDGYANAGEVREFYWEHRTMLHEIALGMAAEAGVYIQTV